MPEHPPVQQPFDDPVAEPDATVEDAEPTVEPSVEARREADEPDRDAAAGVATTSPNGRHARGQAHGARVADVRLTGDRLVVRLPSDGERTTNSGLLIPATAAPAPKRLIWGDVALAGPDVRVAKVGDRVLFLPQSGLEVELDGEELVLLRERDVQAVSSAPTSATERVPGQYL